MGMGIYHIVEVRDSFFLVFDESRFRGKTHVKEHSTPCILKEINESIPSGNNI